MYGIAALCSPDSMQVEHIIQLPAAGANYNAMGAVLWHLYNHLYLGLDFCISFVFHLSEDVF